MSADRFGAIPIPLVAPATPDQADPLLFHVLSFAQAVLNADAGDAWRALTSQDQVVKNIYPGVDPKEGPFSDARLPALFAWRHDEKEEEHLAEDWVVSRGQMTLLYVLPDLPQERQSKRTSMYPLLMKVLARALRDARHKAYVVTGDPEPTAVKRGSILARYAGYMSIWPRAWKPIKMVPASRGGEENLKVIAGYDAIEQIYDIEERLLEGTDDGVPNTQWKLTTDTADTPPLVTGVALAK